MADVAYRSWALIAVDPDPAARGPSSTHPPMLTAIAVDRGGSLVFLLTPHGGPLKLRLETTALSAEGRDAGIFRPLTGSRGDAYRDLAGVSWTKTVEGIYGVFTCTLEDVDTYLKLHSVTDNNLIVTGIRFTTP